MENKNYYSGQEYVEDKIKVMMRFDIKLYSPSELLPFEFYYKKLKINGLQEGRFFKVSFTKNLPRKLVDNISNNKMNAQKYIYGYLFVPLKRINEEILRQRYELGNFLANTFSFFDITEIVLTNTEENPTDEIITIPWPPVFTTPPYSQISNGSPILNPPVYIKDYIDAWNDYFKGDYDNCIRKIITSVENSFSFYEFNKKNKYSWWKIISRIRAKKPSFKKILLKFKNADKFIGNQVVCENILYLYQIRNKITHSSLRIHQENGWWLCGKALETLSYFYQFIDKDSNKINGRYVFSIYGFANLLFHETRGCTIEKNEEDGKFMNDETIDMKEFIIDNDNDMNNWKFNCLKITKEEQSKINNNNPRE